MSRNVNFADPDFEPSDEDLEALVHEAFADVVARREAALAELYEQIAELARERAASMAQLVRSVS